MLQLSSVIGTDIEDRLLTSTLHERLVDLPRNTREMLTKRLRYSGKVRVIAEQNLLSNSEVELCSFAVCAVNDTQWIERLPARFLWLKEVVAPGLQAQIDCGFKVPAVAHSAPRVHSAAGSAIALPAVRRLFMKDLDRECRQASDESPRK
jgi:hypothetical protein